LKRKDGGFANQFSGDIISGTMSFDTIIIGGGMAGLYSAHLLRKQSPETTFLVLEKTAKSHMGGRTNNEMFYGTQVVTGAGVGRKKKDKWLLSLLRELDIPISEYKSAIHSSFPTTVDIESMMETAKRHPALHEITFQEGLIDLFGEEKYRDFKLSSGFTDYEKADMYETLYHYGMDDNVGGWTGFGVPWKRLVETLYHKIGETRFRFSSAVEKIREIQGKRRFEITTESGATYFADRVIVATDIAGIRRILPGASKPDSVYRKIHGQPFLKLYAKFNKESADIVKEYVKGYTVVRGPLQKIIPMDAEKGVYMIAYADNQHAVSLKRYLENTPPNRETFSRFVEKALGIRKGVLTILALRPHYWPIGTHYYEPLGESAEDFWKKIQHPQEGILVVGEVVSRHQGWVEGALESVKTGFRGKWA